MTERKLGWKAVDEILAAAISNDDFRKQLLAADERNVRELKYDGKGFTTTIKSAATLATIIAAHPGDLEAIAAEIAEKGHQDVQTPDERLPNFSDNGRLIEP